MLRMCGHILAGFFAVNFDDTSTSIEICYKFKKFTLLTCNNLTKTLQE